MEGSCWLNTLTQTNTHTETHVVRRQSKTLIEMSSLLEIVCSAAERLLYGPRQTSACVHPLLLLCKRHEHTHQHTHRQPRNNELTRKRFSISVFFHLNKKDSIFVTLTRRKFQNKTSKYIMQSIFFVGFFFS